MCFIQTLLESFLLFLSAPNIEDVKDTYEEYMDTWLQSHLPLLNEKHFSMFRLIFEKSIVTSLVNLKHAQTLSILMFLLSIFSHLIHSYNKWTGDEPEQHHKSKQEHAELKRLQLLDQLDELLIISTGFKDFAFILKNVRSSLTIKDVFFMLIFLGPINFMAPLDPSCQKFRV